MPRRMHNAYLHRWKDRISYIDSIECNYFLQYRDTKKDKKTWLKICKTGCRPKQDSCYLSRITIAYYNSLCDNQSPQQT